MKAKELMIGDWVSLSKGNWSESKQVELIDIEMIAESVYFAAPIPLTAEILEKNGFEYYHKNYASLSYGHPLQIAMDRWPDENGLNGLWRIGGIIEIRYVHTLQHALRLCGIVKEIVL